MSDKIDEAIAFHQDRVDKVEKQIAALTDKAADTAEVATVDTRTGVSGNRGTDRLAQLYDERDYHRKRLNALAIPRRYPVAAGTDEIATVMDEIE